MVQHQFRVFWHVRDWWQPTLECEGLLGNVKFQFLKRLFFQLILNKSSPHVFGLKNHVETVKWNIHRANSWAHEGLLKHFLSRCLSPDFDVQKTPCYYGGNPQNCCEI